MTFPIHYLDCEHNYSYCQCGMNKNCLICGYGHGQIPCECSPKIVFVTPTLETVTEEIMIEFADAWKALADL